MFCNYSQSVDKFPVTSSVFPVYCTVPIVATSLKDPQTGHVLGLSGHPVPPLDLGVVVLLRAGVLTRAQEGCVIPVR